MRNKKMLFFFLIVVIAAAAGFWIVKTKLFKKTESEVMTEVSPFIGSVKTFISCTGSVFPKNRLEIKPPVNGRIERFLVKEGDQVKNGQILAWMSSTERAALLDAAKGKGDEVLKYWEETYKSIPLTAPIDGEVIVAKVQPGQTVTTTDAVVVISDRLIVRAQVDETDIGKISSDKKAIVTLDAYPDNKINAGVEHIYYESKTVNNVTIYEVDLLPAEISDFFRSGMNANIDFIEQHKENILVIPVSAVKNDESGSYVLIDGEKGKEPQKRPVELGITDDKNIEVISGVTENDKIIVDGKKYTLPKNNSTGKNPFLPNRRR